MVRTFFLPPQDIDVPLNKILSRSGILGTSKPPEEMEEHLNRAIELVNSVATPQAVYETVKCSWDGEKLHILNKELKGKLIQQQMRDAEYATLIAATIGHTVENLISTLMESEETLLSFLCDAYASELTEAFVRKLDEHMRNEMRKYGYVGGARISPGYVDLPLNLNTVIVQHLKATERIELSVIPESGQLSPRKSVVAMIGWKRS